MKNPVLIQTANIGAIFISIFLMTGCSKNEPIPNTDDVTGITSITSVFPQSAKGGETITVYGKNLLKDTTGFTLTVNSKKAEVKQFTNDSLKVTVPEKVGSGKVEINIAGKTYAGPEFTYLYVVTVTTVAGTGAVGRTDGYGSGASFYCPWGIVTDDNGDLYIADSYNRLIRKISATTKQVSTIPIPGSVRFYSPYNITIDKRSKSLYVTDFNEHLAKVTADGNMSVIFNDTMPLAGIALAPDDHLYVSNTNYGEILRLDTTGKNKTLFANGMVTPRNIFFDGDNVMYVAGYDVYKMNSNGSYKFFIGRDKFHGWEMVADTAGNFYEADHVNNVIRMFEKNGTITTIAGSGNGADVDGIGLNASFDGPQGIAIDKDGNLFVTTYNYDRRTGNKVRKVSLK